MKKRELLVLGKEEALLKKMQLREEYRKLRFKQVLGYLDNPMGVRNVRRNLARLNTRLSQLQQMEGQGN